MIDGLVIIVKESPGVSEIKNQNYHLML